MNSYAVLVYIRQFHEHLDAFHLVSHLSLTALSVDRFLKLSSSVLCSSIILNINKISSLGHVHLPSSELGHVGVLHHL